MQMNFKGGIATSYEVCTNVCMYVFEWLPSFENSSLDFFNLAMNSCCSSTAMTGRR